MKFSLIDKKNGIYIFQLDNKNHIKICPSRGGIITNWVSNSESILYFDQKRFLQKSKSIRGGIPILFPICGDLQSKSSIFGSKFKQLMQHGFARELVWKCFENKDNNSLCLTLKANEFSRQYYPFNFEINIDLFLHFNKLEFFISIYNHSSVQMPVNFGLHPYLNISDFSNIEFINPPVTCLDQQKNNLRLTSSALKNIKNGVDLLTYSSGKTLLKDNFYKRIITLTHPYPFDLGVYWSDPPRKMVCIEPWTSPRNSFIDQFRKIYISAEQSKKLYACLSINRIE